MKKGGWKILGSVIGTQ
jgi:hypothetical protein